MSTLPPLVLVTGGTSFIGKWVLAKLLTHAANYRVRTTIRDLSRVPEIHSALSEAKVPEDRIITLDTVTANLLNDAGWSTAMKDVTYVLHIASPLPGAPPKDENDLIVPAVEGTKRVLRAARDAGVKRVVVTSSIAAVWHGKRNDDKEEKVFDETDWTDLSDPHIVAAYPKSKTLAERAAWDFMKEEKNMELVSINPVNVYGPALGSEDSTSLRAVGELLQGSLPGIPRVHWGAVDVRDCAEMHVLAMTHPKACGERFICIGQGGLWMSDMAAILRERLGDKGKKVTTLVLPNFVVRAVALFIPLVRLILNDLGVERATSCDKAREVLGWEWRFSTEEAILAAAESLMRYNRIGQ